MRTILAAQMIPVLLIAVCSQADQELLVNGDFETGDLTGWTWVPTLHAEPMMTTEVVPFDVTGLGASPSFRVNPGKDVSYQDAWSGGGTLSQSVYMAAGQEYLVSFSAAIRTMLTLPNMQGGRIGLAIDSSTLWQWNVGYMEGATTRRDSFAGVYQCSSSGQHDLSLTFTRTSGNWGTTPYPVPRIYHYVDRVSVTPEPATLGLLGLGGLALLRRRAGR